MFPKACVTIVVMCVLSCDESPASLDTFQTRDVPAVGTRCEIVLRPDLLVGRDEFITPQQAQDNVNGSKDSVWGRFVAINDDWIIIDMDIIRMDVKDGKTTTYGDAGITQRHRYWVPREHVLYLRVWTE